MQDPNEKQVGGNHYKGVSFQPWDWAKLKNGAIGYYEVSAIAYVTRYRRKGGVEDLKKVLHYLDKIIFEAKAGEYSCGMSKVSYRRVMQYNRENKCDLLQSEAVHLLVQWRDMEDLMAAIDVVNELIARESEEDHSEDAVSYLVVPASPITSEDFIREFSDPGDIASATVTDVKEDDVDITIVQPPANLAKQLAAPAAPVVGLPEKLPPFVAIAPSREVKRNLFSWDREDSLIKDGKTKPL